MHYIRLITSLLLCLSMLVGSVATPASAVVATTTINAISMTEATSSPFSASTSLLTASLDPGQQQQVTLTLTNKSSSPHTPRLYAAWPALPTGVSTRREIAPDLRQVALPEQESRIDPQLERDLSATVDGRTEFLVFLQEQADLSPAYSIADWNERGRFVYETLYTTATQSQTELRTWLEQQGLPYRPLWIVNALVVEGSDTDVQTLAARAEVALLRANRVTSLEGAMPLEGDAALPLGAPALQFTIPSSCDPDDRRICWNIRKIQADRVWYEFGVSGEGITVATIDSGVRYDHPALLRQYRGYSATGTIDHSYNWFDPQRPASNAFDAGNHGTHTMGTIVGRADQTSGTPAVGVAPGARWIAARGCQTSICTEADLLAAAQWLLTPTDPDGSNPRPDLRPQIINNSWATSSQADEKYIGFTTAWRAAGIFPVFAAGNAQNTRCGTIASPGDYAHVVGVGATSREDLIASFSSIGPAFNNLLKPDISAPGQGIVSTFAGADLSYGTLQGTSMAAPHVAGTVALIWSANPTLIGDYDATYTILTQSAAPRTDDRFRGPAYSQCEATRVPNNVYGYGRVDAYAAVARAMVNVPWLQLPRTIPTMDPTETISLTLTFNAAQVPGPGNYRARVLVHTADVSQAPLTIDVQLTVRPSSLTALVQGSIRDAESNAPLAGSVQVSGGSTITIDPDGTFALTLPVRTTPYTLIASAPGYESQSVELLAEAGATITQVFTLRANLPRLHAQTTPLTATLTFGEAADLVATVENTGTRELRYQLLVPDEAYGIWRSDELAGPEPAWMNISANNTPIALQNDDISAALPLGFAFPFYGETYDTVYVHSNGLLTFTEPTTSPTFHPRCLPLPETSGVAIVPLRVDLDPAQGGMVRYANMNEGFVVMFENVPLYAAPQQRFTFQVVLTRDGRVVFNYNQISALPNSAVVGIQQNTRHIQQIGCGRNIPIQSGLTLEFRPQPNPQLWIEVAERDGAIAPGATHDIPIRLKWITPTVFQPYSSAVLVKSNDPYQPVVRLPVHLTTTPAPYTTFFPLFMHQRNRR